jgi:hypothetical protein
VSSALERFIKVNNKKGGRGDCFLEVGQWGLVNGDTLPPSLNACNSGPWCTLYGKKDVPA